MSAWVRMPVGLSARLRSAPIMMPHTMATTVYASAVSWATREIMAGTVPGTHCRPITRYVQNSQSRLRVAGTDDPLVVERAEHLIGGSAERFKVG